jgi:hypothetical protein
VIRQVDGAGFDLRLPLRDMGVGRTVHSMYRWRCRGLALGFCISFRLAKSCARCGNICADILIAVPENCSFAGGCRTCWRSRDGPALGDGSLFRLSHFNKRAMHFNWAFCWRRWPGVLRTVVACGAKGGPGR